MTAPDIPEDIRAKVVEAIREADIADCARRWPDVPISQITESANGLAMEYEHAADAAIEAIEPFIASERTRATEAAAQIAEGNNAFPEEGAHIASEIRASIRTEGAKP